MRGEFSSKFKNAIERTPLQSLLILTEYLRIIWRNPTSSLWISKVEHRLNLLFSFCLKYEGDIPFGSLDTICIMICPHICLSVNTNTHASVHTHNWPCLRMRCTYIIRKNVYQKTAIPVIQAFILYFHRNRISLGAYLTYLASQDTFSWVPNCPKNKPVWAMWKCIVFISK